MLNKKSKNNRLYIASKPSVMSSGLVSTIASNRSNRLQIYSRTSNSATPPTFLKLNKINNITNINLKKNNHLETYFKQLKFNNNKELYKFNENTPYSQIFITNNSFKNGTLRITTPGRYTLLENIIFNPNEDNDFKPTKKQIENKIYPTRIEGAYNLGFFAAITIESNDVVLDLNGHYIRQSPLHNLQQRFYSHIELANAPFIPKQGPAQFSNENNYRSTNYCLIENGILGLSSHHGIHGNGMKNVLIRNLNIIDFEVAAIALNGAKNSAIKNINVEGASKDIPVLSTYSQSRFIIPFLDIVKKIDPKATLEIHSGTKTIDQIKNELNDALEKTKQEFINNKEITNKLFLNKTKLYDGNIYGIVLNTNGVVINDFITKRSEKSLGNENIYLENINIKNIISEPLEIIGVNPQKLKDPKLERLRLIRAMEQSAYGGKTQVGPVGDVFQIENNMENFIYKENVLANAQLIVSKYNKDKIGTSNISDEILEWVKKGDDINNYLNDELYFTSGGDSMAHVMKGNIGLFISAGKNIVTRNVNIDNIETKGRGVGNCKLLKENQISKKGGQCIGCCVTGSENIIIYNEKINNIKSNAYNVLKTMNIESKVKHISA